MTRARIWAATVAVFLATSGLFLAVYETHPLLYDTDSYYHLAVARLMAEDGVPDDLPWIRFSALGEGFGDKELLFHLLLAPFASFQDSLSGGRLALALLNGLLLALLTHLGLRAVGWWGLLLAPALILGSMDFAWRVVRLRPELLALILVILALWAAARGRYRLLGLLVALFALSYTAVHALLGLLVLLFLVEGWAGRGWRWPLVLYPVLGAGLAFLLHPNFPANLLVWKIQSVDFFLRQGSLDVGTEIQPHRFDVVLMANLGWCLTVLAFWRSLLPPGESSEEASPDAGAMARAFGTGAMVFGLLYLLMARFSLYFFPLATLWLFWSTRARGARPGRWTRLPGRGRIPLVVALGLCLAVALPALVQEGRRFARRTNPGPARERVADRERLALAIPSGARVAAPWGSTPIFVFWAPQGRYLNLLDPVFMEAFYPRQYWIQRRIFQGLEPDTPLAAVAGLESEYLAYSLVRESPRLTQRLSADPRVRLLHRGFNGLFQMSPAPRGSFMLDWRGLPADSPLPPPLSRDLLDLPAYPRHPDPQGQAVEAYVDLRRLGSSDSCMAVAQRRSLSTSQRLDVELAPYGPATLWVDDKLMAQTRSDMQAILGQGFRFPIHLSPGEHTLTVRSCPGSAVPLHNGFYLRIHSREPSTVLPVPASADRMTGS